MSDRTTDWRWWLSNAIIGILIYSFGYHRTSALLNDIAKKLPWPPHPDEERANGGDW